MDALQLAALILGGIPTSTGTVLWLSTFANHQASLFKLQQIGSVVDYQLQFEYLSNHVVGLPAEALLNYFISGLKPEIQREMTILQPHSMSHATGLAKLLDAKFQDTKPTPTKFHRPAQNTPYLNKQPPFLGNSPSGPRIRYLHPSKCRNVEPRVCALTKMINFSQAIIA